MKKEKTRVTQELCRKVQIMLAGGAKMAEIGQLLGVGKSTVSRIKIAGFSVEQYEKNNQTRKAEERKQESEPLPAAEKREGHAGQISMEELVKPEEDKKQDMSDQAKLDKVIDYLAQILRKMDGT